ncbi:MAG TPA: beta-L-arabinofuranosidase domain-containing protein [Vicinamibacterales bacterium]|nr:beta-L-arabinofuranosidase domain-containing protein [Vicinamibacterales bacterium]
MRKTATGITRRELLETAGKAAAVAVIATPAADALGGFTIHPQTQPLNAVAGVDRVVMLKGKTYLSAWAGYGAPPRRGRGAGRGNNPPAAPAPPPGPAPTASWSKVSGPGGVSFADPTALVTTATFTETGEYVIAVTADNGTAKATSNLTVKVELPPPAAPLAPVFTTNYRITSPMWASRAKALIVNWIPHCVDQCNRTDLVQGPGSGAGGIDNFIEAGKALRGEPHGKHKGYVFSNAWVHQTVESMCLALMVDAQGDKEILAAQARMRATLDDWIPRILAAQHPDGYLQTAFTLRDMLAEGETYPAGGRGPWVDRWTPSHRNNHEGYVAGYFIESAINHYMMTGGKDRRLYNAAKKLADCWADHLGPPPKQAWFDGHQEMEQALVRLGRFVNEVERPGARAGAGPGDRYIALAKFLLDCRQNGSEYEQSHLPVVQQYEAVGHAVRAMYTYSGMADVAVETRDVDYQSAIKSIWDNVVHRKYYLTGGVGSGESAEGFGPNYSLRNNAYCETCSSCGEVFMQWKLHLAYHDARFADLYEQTMYNALVGSLALDGRNFYYDNPLDARVVRYPWHSVPCCVGNLPRTVLMLPTWMYSRGADGLFVNLFAGSRVSIDGVAGTTVEMVQTTDYPWDGRIAIVVNPAVRKTFTIRLRVPDRDVSSLYTPTPVLKGYISLSVNGRRMTPKVVNGYAEVTRAWAKGDRIDYEVPMAPQRIHGSDEIEATRGRVALRYGPLVYNIEQVDQDITRTLAPGSPLSVDFRKDLLGGVPVITGRFADGSPLTAIPNFVRMNRNPPPPPRPANQPPPPPPAAGQPRPAPPPPTSIVWITEG